MLQHYQQQTASAEKQRLTSRVNNILEDYPHNTNLSHLLSREARGTRSGEGQDIFKGFTSLCPKNAMVIEAIICSEDVANHNLIFKDFFKKENTKKLTKNTKKLFSILNTKKQTKNTTLSLATFSTTA